MTRINKENHIQEKNQEYQTILTQHCQSTTLQYKIKLNFKRIPEEETEGESISSGGERERARKRKRDLSGGEREVLHASSLRGEKNKRPQWQFGIAVSGLKQKILDIQAHRIQAQLSPLSRELCDLRMEFDQYRWF